MAPIQEHDRQEKTGNFLGRLARAFNGPTSEERQAEQEEATAAAVEVALKNVQNLGSGIYRFNQCEGIFGEGLARFLNENTGLKVLAMTPEQTLSGGSLPLKIVSFLVATSTASSKQGE